MPVGNITPIHSLSGQTNTGGGTKDHEKLVNRDAKDQHPIKSITGLEDALKDLESKIDGGGKAVKKEQERAEAAEQALNEQINAEKARAEEAEEIIEGNAKEYTDTKVNELSEDVDGRLKALNEQINAEIIPQIEAVEAELPPIKTDITNINNNIDLINRKIDDISIEELSRREVTRTYEAINPALNDKFVLATEYDATAKYYHKVLDVHTTQLNGMWTLNSSKISTAMTWDELNEFMEGEASFWWNVNCYWYNNNVKKSFNRIGLILPTPGTGSWMIDQDIYGLGLANSFEIDRYGAISSTSDIADGVIAFPVRHTRDYDYQSETGYKDIDYNPLGEPGLYPETFKTVYFNINAETPATKMIAKLIATLAEKISDTNLDPGDTNYKTRFDYVEVTEEEFNENPNEYYVYQETFENEIDPSTLVANDNKETGYYPVYEYNENETYYELVYDSNPNNTIGIWEWDDNLIPAIHTNEADREAGLEHTDFWCERGTFVWYDDYGRRHEHHAVGILGYNWLAGGYSGWRYRRFWDSTRREWMWGTDICPLGLGYGEANGVSWCGIQFEWAALYPKKDLIQQWKDSDISDEKGVYLTVDDYRDFLDSVLNDGKSTDSTYWYNNGMKKLWVTDVQGSFGGGSLLRYLKQNAIKLSDELLPYGNNNYKTKYIPVEVTSETFVPGKYFTYYNKENSQIQSNAFIISTKNYVETEQYYKIFGFDKVSKKPLYKKVALTEEEFYAPDSDYYKLISFAPIEMEYNTVRIELNDEASIYRNGIGEDLIKITDTNVYVGGEKLIPNLKVVNNSYTTVLAENNAETVFNNPIESLQIVIPESVKHGFCFYTSFETGATTPIIIFNNNSHKPLKFIMSGTVVKQNELEFATETQYNLMFLCNGIYLEVYIQEIQLLG